MRLDNNSKNTNYWNNLSMIEKRENQNHAYYIQLFNNNIIDEFIEKYLKDEDMNAKPSFTMLFNELWLLNQPQVYREYERLLQSPYIDNASLFQILIKNKANTRCNTVTLAEVERINKNLDYVEEVLDKHEVNLQEYKKIAQREKRTANRINILEQCTFETDYALTEFGINSQPHFNTYRNLDVTAEALNRQTQMEAKWDECDAINRQCRRQGLLDEYTKKEWIWTNKGKTTRHKGNDGQVVDFYEKFECVHDKTGKVDMIMYPSDPSGSFENCWICYCQARYF